VAIAPLDDNLAIRVWGGDIASVQVFSFDFINGQQQYILTPPGLKIYAESDIFSPSSELTKVLSIEASLEQMKVESVEFRTSAELARGEQADDPNWETYLIPEGTRLRITQPGKVDCFLNIPYRTPPNGRALTLQP